MDYRQLHTLTLRFFMVLTAGVLWSVPGYAGSLKVMLPIEPLLLLYLPLLLTIAWIRRKKWRWQPLDVGLLALLTAGLITIPWAVSAWIAAKAWIVLATYALAFYGTWRMVHTTPSERNTIWRIYAYSYGALMIYSIFQLLSLGIGYHASYDMALPFSQGHTLLVAAGFPLFLRTADRLARGKAKVLNLSFLLIFMLFIALSYSRMYWLAVPFFLFLLIVKYWTKGRWWLIAIAIVAIAGGYLCLQQVKAERAARKAWEDPDDHKTVTAQILSITTWHANDSNLDRLNRWKIGWMMFQDHPVTGVGLNNYFHVFNSYPTQVDYYSDEREGKAENAHNIYLGWLSEMGIAGAIAGLLFIATQWMQWWRVRQHPAGFLALLLILNFMLLGMIEDYQFYEKVLPYWLFSLGWIVAIKQQTGTARE